MKGVSLEALELHRRAVVCDAHCDTILGLERQGRSLGERSATGHVDLPRLLEGGVTAQVFALFVEDVYLPAHALHRTLQLLDRFYRELEANGERMLLATSAADIRRAKAEGKVAAILGLEGGEALDGLLATLRLYHRLGVRLLTLTWNRRNALADGLDEARTDGGLTRLGVEVVEEMNRLGMLIDLAHLSPAGLADVLQVTTSPVIVSHANAQALYNHRRNLSDEQLRAVALTGGWVGATFVPQFIAPQNATLDHLLEHIVHMVRVAGEDHVGLGSDHDGFNPLEPLADLPDVSYLPRLTEGLLRRGLSERVVEKVLGGNFLRVFEEVVG
ncbi:MAG: dipeptidase [Chloroflexia bacterium]